MATQTRDPTSDISFTGTWSGSASTRFTLVDDYPSQVDTDILTHGTATPGEGLFGFTAFSVPAGSFNIVVKVNIYAYKNSGAGNSFSTRLRAGSTPANVDGTAITTLGNGSGAIALFTQSFPTNPKTSAAWTVADVNGAATNGLNAFGIVASDANPSISITSIQLQVDYDPIVIPLAVGETVTLTETRTVTLIHTPIAAESLTLTDTASAQRYEAQWLGTLNLLEMPQIADTVTISDSRTVSIPAEGLWQCSVADQVTLQDAVIVDPLFIGPVLTPLAGETVTIADNAWYAGPRVEPLASESVGLTDLGSALIGNMVWLGTMNLVHEPHAGESLTLIDVQTVGNDRYAEIAWIEMEIPASSTEIDVPFGIVQSGQISIQLKYRGTTNKIRAILATNLSGQAGTFVVNDNGAEQLVTIPHGTVAQELDLTTEVTLGNGVSCRFKPEKVSQ